MRDHWRKLTLFAAVYLAAALVPFESDRVRGAVSESLALLAEYAREHVLLCLIPALFIAGAIAVFLSQQSVMRYLGATANRVVAYAVASISGTILAVCSCTVLPLFAGIYMRGAGLGPAVAFLYSGPAISVLAIVLTARVLGLEMGLARAVGAVGFAFIVGLTMQGLFARADRERIEAQDGFGSDGADQTRPLWATVVYFGVMIAILVFANWARPLSPVGLWAVVFELKWAITGVLVLALVAILASWFRKDELKTWTSATWGFAQQILPLLFGGVLVAGLLLGRPGHEGLIPSEWVTRLVGGNSLGANLFAALSGAFMYFATLTEVPIVQGLLGSGMGKGPALALLLAGPSMSLPSLLVIGSVIGVRRTAAYCVIVVALATVTGAIYGLFAGN